MEGLADLKFKARKRKDFSWNMEHFEESSRGLWGDRHLWSWGNFSSSVWLFFFFLLPNSLMTENPGVQFSDRNQRKKQKFRRLEGFKNTKHSFTSISFSYFCYRCLQCSLIMQMFEPPNKTFRCLNSGQWMFKVYSATLRSGFNKRKRGRKLRVFFFF